MKILLCNDDGIDSPGLKELARTFSDWGELYVIAPEGERSSHSHHTTIMGKVRYEERSFPYARKAYALWGTPADCVFLGMDILLKEDIDFVLSGINKGGNMSRDIIYSGTVAAAREAFFRGIPSCAVSVNSFTAVHYETAARFAREICHRYLQLKKPDFFLNINVPDLPYEEIRGIRVCDQRAVYHYDNSLTLIEEEGKTYVKFNELHVHIEGDIADPAIDINAVEEGYVALSPLGDDPIEHGAVDTVKKMLE